MTDSLVSDKVLLLELEEPRGNGELGTGVG
jgi:hypothetical protein